MQECAVKVLKCINDDELLSFQRVNYFTCPCGSSCTSLSWGSVTFCCTRSDSAVLPCAWTI